ncbi:NAD(P)H-binding protein [Actinomycetospora sp. TBRC 11914]|uniref:NmrA family NAD(P)-binding protein n=1 Tax=Actinomycetospora sp. TBRC 11914 TaxID=2729387 RepID=UPI00145DA71B|nr:NAD(P)H-binding protein [Actinomycetospora sp. TBRC 11914]NMO92993.1 NAD(P)H-binding protein [Actinomycetospora sp. TBRC 11914]
MTPHEPAVVAVTGATGALGSRVARQLAEHAVPQLLVARDPRRLPRYPGTEHRGPAAYDDRAAMRDAVAGATTVVLVSGRPTGRRLEEHATVVEAAVEAGVERVLYVSLLGAAPDATYRNARDHWLTEQYLAAAPIRHTVVRAGIYASTPASLADHELVVRGPGGSGRAAFVAHEDLAAVITALALDEHGDEHDGAVLEVTGPEALTLEEAVEEIARASGKPYRYVRETPEEAFTRRLELGLSGEQIEAWISWYLAIADGGLATVTDVVPRLTGDPATPVSEIDWWPAPGRAS